MKKIALLAAGAAALGGGIAVATTASAASSTDAVRAVQTASKGVSHKAYELDRERNRWEVTFADGTQRHVTLDGRRVTATRATTTARAAAASARVSLATALRTAAPRANGTLDRRRPGPRARDARVERELRGSGDRETEVEVDARSGKVLRVTQDDD